LENQPIILPSYCFMTPHLLIFTSFFQEFDYVLLDSSPEYISDRSIDI